MKSFELAGVFFSDFQLRLDSFSNPERVVYRASSSFLFSEESENFPKSALNRSQPFHLIAFTCCFSPRYDGSEFFPGRVGKPYHLSFEVRLIIEALLRHTSREPKACQRIHYTTTAAYFLQVLLRAYKIQIPIQ